MAVLSCAFRFSSQSRRTGTNPRRQNSLGSAPLKQLNTLEYGDARRVGRVLADCQVKGYTQRSLRLAFLVLGASTEITLVIGGNSDFPAIYRQL